MRGIGLINHWSLKAVIFSLLMAFSLVSLQGSVGAQNQADICGGTKLTFSESARGCVTRDAQNRTEQDRINDLIANIINIFSIIVGIVAVIMIVFGGFKFITSGGDSAKVTAARNTVLYAVIGLIIVALAQIIARFVLRKATE